MVSFLGITIGGKQAGEHKAAPTNEERRAEATRKIEIFANNLGITGDAKENLVFSGANAAVANGGSINQANLTNEASKVTGIPSHVLAQAMEAGKGAQAAGMTHTGTDFSGAQVVGTGQNQSQGAAMFA